MQDFSDIMKDRNFSSFMACSMEAFKNREFDIPADSDSDSRSMLGDHASEAGAEQESFNNEIQYDEYGQQLLNYANEHDREYSPEPQTGYVDHPVGVLPASQYMDEQLDSAAEGESFQNFSAINDEYDNTPQQLEPPRRDNLLH